MDPVPHPLIFTVPQQPLLLQPKSIRRGGRRTNSSWRKRDQQDSRLYNLGLDIVELKHQIQRLTETRDLLVSRSLRRYDDLDGSSLKTVVEYFRVFRHGLNLSPVDAIQFLHEIMSEDVLVNSIAGRDVVVEQWKVHSMCFKNIEFRVLEAKVVPLTETQAVVKCTAGYGATITRLTLGLMFPHILKTDRIVDLLVGRRIESFGLYDFVFDATTRRFVRCEVVMDLMSAFAKLLPNPRDLAVLFKQAMIADEFYIGDTDDIQVLRSSSSAGRIVEEINSATTEEPQTPPLGKMQLSHILDEEDA